MPEPTIEQLVAWAEAHPEEVGDGPIQPSDEAYAYVESRFSAPAGDDAEGAKRYRLAQAEELLIRYRRFHARAN
jgi:hypothetical protein